MKRLFFTLLLGAFILNMSAQPWKQYFNNEKAPDEITLDDYRDAFYSWVEDNEIVDGKKLVDGQWVKVPGYKQFRRWEYYWESRVNADNSFPNTSAYDEMQKHGKSKDIDSWAGNWTSMGPNSTPGGYAGLGRVNCIEFHPTNNNTFWIGTPAGGLWRTTDGGNTWTPLTDNNGVLGVSDIALANDFETSNTMYIATGDRAGGSLWALGGNNANDNNSIGVLKSTDGGETWTQTGLTFLPKDRIVLGRLLIDPNDGNIMLAGATDGIYRSEDAGETWTKVFTNFYAIDMEFHPTNSNIVYATNGEAAYVRILKSTDNGASFTQMDYVTGSVRGEIAVTPADPDRVYVLIANSNGGLKGIYKSTDAGDTFTQEFDGNTTNGSLLGYYSNGSGDNEGQGSYDLCIAASPTNADEVFIGGVNTWKSTNAGSNWGINNMWTSGYTYNMAGAPVAHADKHVLKYRPSDGALFEGNDGGIYKSTNNGSSWQDLSSGLRITQIYRLGVSATNQNMVIIGNQDNGSKLINGTNWSDVTGGDGMECLIDYTTAAIQYATYVDGKLYKTSNTWATKTTISDNIPGGENGAWVSPYMIDPENPAVLYVGYDKLWKTTNRGASWTQLGSITSTGDKFRSMAICQSNNDVMLVADLKKVYKTSNGGANWSEVTANISTTNNITNVAIHAENPEIMWATTGGYTPSRVYQSTNGGTSWVDISEGLPQIPVYTVVHNKLHTEALEIYIGTELGIYMKRGDSEWIPFMKGLPNVVVSELEIYYGSDIASSKLRAATFGRGLWESELFAVESEFSATPTSGELPLDVVFTNLSKNANVFFWAFGDGTTTTDPNPTHTYNSEGVYDVTLTAACDLGSNVTKKTGYITILGNAIEYVDESSFNIYPNPGKGVFTIKGTEKYIGQKVDIKLINQNGKIVKTIPMAIRETNTIDLTGEAPGVYYLVFPFENNRLMNKLIIQ